MSDEETPESGDKSSQTQDKAPETEKKGKKSNEITKREKVYDLAYVRRIEEKTEKH